MAETEISTGPARPRLFINHLSDLDWLIAVEFGRVDDGQPKENWRGVSDSFGYLHNGPQGPAVGFKIVEFSRFDPEDDEVAEIWEGPRFDAPVLGLRDAAAGEVVLAVRSFFGEKGSINRQFFNAAMHAEGEDARTLWLACLQAGDPMAHYGLGYTLYDLGRFPEAYRHLRHYTELAPNGTWPWRWLGKATEAIGEIAEARTAYERAIMLEGQTGEETDAAELLERLKEGAGDPRPSPPSEAVRPSSPSWWEFNLDETVSCGFCGWSGVGRGHEEATESSLIVRCPKCSRQIVVALFPTAEETRLAVAAGNPRALAELPAIEAREARNAKADELKLKVADDLPELGAREIRVDWDFEEHDDEAWTVLRHEGHDLWRELAFFEGYERFAEVFEILRVRYGSRLVEVRPTKDSELYLYGDRPSALPMVSELNASLVDGEQR